MGTRSMTYILNSNGQCLTAQYAQYDGYPECVGKELCDIITGKYPGIPDTYICELDVGGEKVNMLVDNGMGCLAASFIKFRKEKPLNVYLEVPPVSEHDFYSDAFSRKKFLKDLNDDARCYMCEYSYVIYRKDNDNAVYVICTDLRESDPVKAVLYDGPVHKFYKFLEIRKKQEEEAANAMVDDIAQPLAPISVPDGVTVPDIEFICNPEYDN